MTRLIDNNFNVISDWETDYYVASTPYILPDASVLIPYRAFHIPWGGGAMNGRISRFNFWGELLWDYVVDIENISPHHDIEPLPNGNILLLSWEKKSYNDAIQMGKVNIELGYEIWPTVIHELEPVGFDSVNIVWEWHLWDHLIQDIDPNLPSYGIISENPQLIDINLIDIPFSPVGSTSQGDWFHCNSIHYNSSLDQIVFSSRFTDEFYIIDHSTTIEEAASSYGGIYEKGGDILYRWGNPLNYGRGDSSHQKLNNQHSVNWISDGFPGAGNIIVFNNGYSNVLELDLPHENGHYFLDENDAFLPEDALWIYDGNFDSGYQSGAFRLKNGNTLVTLTTTNRIIEINQIGEIVWDFQLQEGTPPGGYIATALQYSLEYFNNNLLLSNKIGWNLVGLPFNAINPEVSSIYPNSNVEASLSFGSEYFESQNMMNGKGYWINFEQEFNTLMLGDSKDELDIHLNNGWNLISGLSESISITNIIDDAGIIVPNTIYGYSYGYHKTDSLKPGNGYWLRTINEGTISMNHYNITSNHLNTISYIDSLLYSSNRIITNGNNILHFNSPNLDDFVIEYSMPPKPPDGAFDIRFFGDMMICNNDSCFIEVTSDYDSLNINFIINDFNNREYVWVIYDTEEIKILNSMNDMYRIRESGELLLKKK